MSEILTRVLKYSSPFLELLKFELLNKSDQDRVVLEA